VAAPNNTSGHRSRRKGPQSDADGSRKPSRKRASQEDAEKEPKRAKKPTRQELARQVSQELVKLRPILKDIGTALLDRLDGELAVLSRGLAGEGQSDDLPNVPRAPILSGMLADIEALKVKPKKGRVKDLGRIEALLESLSRRMPPEV
jgi:hypothetical protein